MAQDIKQKIVLEGEKEYNAAIKEAQRNLKTLKSELKAETAELGKNATAQQKAEVKTKSLQKQIAEQEKIVKANKDALEEVREKYGDNAEAVAKWEQKLNESRATLANMKNSIEDVGEAFANVDSNAQMGVVATKSFADALNSVGSAAGNIADSIEGAFSSVLSTISEAVTALWDEVMQVAAKANAWTDLADYFGTTASNVQKWSNAIQGAGGSFDNFTTILNRFKTGGVNKKITEYFGISDVNYKDDLEYTLAVLDQMAKRRKEMEANGTWDSALADIFGGRRSQAAGWFISNWDQIQENASRYDAENGGVGMTSEDLSTMNQLYIDVQNLLTTWQAFKESFLAGAFGKLSLDLVGNAQGILDGLIAFMSAENDSERDAAIQQIEDNMTSFFTRLGEAIEAAAKALDKVGTDLAGSENGYVAMIGKALQGLSDVLEWLTKPDTISNVEKFFETIIGVWVGAKALSAVANIAAFASHITTIGKYLGLGGAGAAGAGASGATGAASSGGLLTGITNGLNGILPGVASWVSVNGGPVWDWLTHESPFAGLLTGQETLGDFWERLKGKFSEENIQDFKDNWDPNNPDANVIAKLFGDRSQNADAASRLPSGANWAPSYMGGYGPGGTNQDLTEVVEDVLLDTLYSDLDRENAVQDWWDAWRTNADDEESAFEWMKEVFGDDFGAVWDQIIAKLDEMENQTNMEDIPSDWWSSVVNKDGLTSEDISGFRSVPGLMLAAVRNGVSGIKVSMDGRTVGTLVAPYVSQMIARDMA